MTGYKGTIELSTGAKLPFVVSRNTRPHELPFRLTLFRATLEPLDHAGLASVHERLSVIRQQISRLLRQHGVSKPDFTIHL